MSELYDLPRTGRGGAFQGPPAPYKAQAKVTLHCDAGYRLPQTTTATVVQKNGEWVWDPPELNCVPVSCGAPFVPTHGKTSHHQFHFPHFFSYVCFEGYRLNQPSNRYYCGVKGEWTPHIPPTTDCVPVECPELKAPLNGSLIVGSRFFQDVAIFRCDPGYTRVQGQERRTCQANGQWEGDEVVCTQLPCPPMPPSVHVLMSNGRITTIDCGEGKQVNVKCLDNGTWSLPFPYCPPGSKTVLPSKGPSHNPPPPPTKGPPQSPPPKKVHPSNPPPAPKNGPPDRSLLWILILLGCFVFLFSFLLYP